MVAEWSSALDQQTCRPGSNPGFSFDLFFLADAYAQNNVVFFAYFLENFITVSEVALEYWMTLEWQNHSD